MATAKAQQSKENETDSVVVVRSRDEYDAYLAKHLKPVWHSPAGHPFYDHEEVKKLNVRLIPS